MKRALIGAGGFADEVKAHIGEFDITCFVDDKYYIPNTDNIKPLSTFNPTEYEVLVCIGDGVARKNIVDRLPKNTKYFTYIHPTAQILGNDVTIGFGSVVCAGSIITTNCKIGNHSHLNLQTTVGHDCVIGDFFTTAPGAKISGNCNIGECVYVGTNASIRQKLNICNNTTIGLNSGVVKDITESGVYGGVPCKLLKLISNE
jgi:sugar O-acyltransferase (sialic acid O-acetyltransferase NeuD family)